MSFAAINLSAVALLRVTDSSWIALSIAALPAPCAREAATPDCSALTSLAAFDTAPSCSSYKACLASSDKPS